MKKSKADPSYIMELSGGYSRSAILHAAVKLDVFTNLSKNPATVEQFAKKIKSDIRGAYILLHALTAMGLLKKKGEKFSNTPDSEEFLVRERKRYYGNMVEFDAFQWEFWGRIADSVVNGDPARTPDMFQRNPDQIKKFILGMHSIAMARGDAEYLAKKINLKGFKRLIDIGGGPGTFPIFFCKANPGLEAAVFDFPGTLKVTSEVIKNFSMQKRIKLIPGDYNKNKLPEGYDIAFLSNIIHAEDYKNNCALMKKIYKSLNPGGMIIIKDHILDKAGINPKDGAIFSTTMLLFTNGKSYRFVEVKKWLEDSGFKDISLIEPGPPMRSQLVTARKLPG